MGNMHSEEMANEVTNGLSLDTALRYQLFSNHYPPLPFVVLELAKQAIELWDNGDHDGTISFENTGIEHRRYGLDVPVAECLDAWHLWSFVDDNEDLY